MASGELRETGVASRSQGLMAYVPGVARQPRWWSALCVIFLCLVPLLLFPSAAFGGEIWTIGDLGNYNYPLHFEIMRQWRSGTVPLWNPHIMSGTPLAASMQGGVFYPPNWPLILLPDALGFAFSILAHIALVGVFTFFYLRSIRLSRWASLTGALVFQLSGFTMSHLGHVAMLRVIPWLPFMLWALQKWSDDQDWRWVSLGALGVGLAILAGYPQVSAYALMTALAYLVFLFFQTRERRWRFLGGGLVVFILGTGLAAVQLFVTAFMWQEYMRVMGASFSYFSLYSFHPSYLLKLIVPLPAPEVEGYVGVPTLVLVAANLPFRHSGQKANLFKFYVALAVFSILLAFGPYTPLAKWMYHIPVYRSFSVLSRHLLEFDFGLAVLAALGLDLLLDSVSGKSLTWTPFKQTVIRVGIGAILLVVLAVVWTAAGPGIPAIRSTALVWDDRINRGIIRALILVLLSVGILGLAKRKNWPNIAAGLLLLLLFVDLSRTTARIYSDHLHPLDWIEVPSRLTTFLKQDEIPYRTMSFVPHPNDPFFTGSHRSRWLLPNFNVLTSIESAAGYDAVMLAQLDEVTDHALTTDGLRVIETLNHPALRRYLDLVGAKYFVVPLETGVPKDLGQQYPVVFENQWTRVLQNDMAFARLFPVPQFETVVHEQAVQVMQEGILHNCYWEPEVIALIELSDDIQIPLAAMSQGFGSTLFLTRFEIESGSALGDDWQFVTWWACQNSVAENYTLYVHLLDSQDNLVAQADHLLGNQTDIGFHPTGTWSCPASIKDTVSIPAHVFTTLGVERVAIGVWKPETGERLSPDPGTLPVDAHGRLILGPVADMISDSSHDWTVSRFAQSGGQVSSELHLSQASLVVHGTNYSGGWKARLDGRKVPLLRVNGFLQGVYVPAGEHLLEFFYRPDSFGIGSRISLCSLGFLIIVYVSKDWKNYFLSMKRWVQKNSDVKSTKELGAE